MEKTVAFAHSGQTLTAVMLRDIDHHTAAIMRSEMDAEIQKKRPRLLVLDFSQVEFMDSSGVGLVMGRLKRMEQNGGNIRIQNLNKRCRRMLQLSGITRIVEL